MVCPVDIDGMLKQNVMKTRLTIIQQFPFKALLWNKVENYELFLKSWHCLSQKNPLHPSKVFVYCHIQRARILSEAWIAQITVKIHSVHS